MHPVFLRVGVVVVVERPPVEVDGVDDQRVAVPLADRIAVVHRLEALAVRAPVERDDPGHPLELVDHHQVVLRLEELHRVAGEHAAGKPRGQAEVARLVVARHAGPRLEERLAAGLERREPLPIEDGRGRPAPLVALQVRRPLIRAREVGLAVRGPRHGRRGGVLRRGDDAVRARRWSSASNARWIARVEAHRASPGVRVLRAGRQDVPAVRERHASARGVVRAVLRAEPFDDDRFAELQLILDDAAAHQLAGRAAGESPGGDGAVSVLHVEVEPDVRVGPLDLLDDAGHLHRLGVVEFGGEGMVRRERRERGHGEARGERETGSHGRQPFDHILRDLIDHVATEAQRTRRGSQYLCALCGPVRVAMRSGVR